MAHPAAATIGAVAPTHCSRPEARAAGAAQSSRIQLIGVYEGISPPPPRCKGTDNFRAANCCRGVRASATPIAERVRPARILDSKMRPEASLTGPPITAANSSASSTDRRPPLCCGIAASRSSRCAARCAHRFRRQPRRARDNQLPSRSVRHRFRQRRWHARPRKPRHPHRRHHRPAGASVRR